MREVKFRAWWDGRSAPAEGMMKTWGELLSEFIPYGEVIPQQEDSGWTLLQYVGLKDCKGTEVYEGDIMRIEHFALGPILEHEEPDYVETSVPVEATIYGFRGCVSLANGADYTRHTIIGNRFENPELVNT